MDYPIASLEERFAWIERTEDGFQFGPIERIKTLSNGYSEKLSESEFQSELNKIVDIHKVDVTVSTHDSAIILEEI